MSTSLRNMAHLTNFITERLATRAQQWAEQASLDDDLRKKETYLDYFQSRSELLKELSSFSQKGESPNDTFRRLVTEMRDFDKFLAEPLDEK